MTETRDTEETPRQVRSWTARHADFVDAQRECNRLGVKQADFLGVLLRAWRSLDPSEQVTFIPKEPVSA